MLDKKKLIQSAIKASDWIRVYQTTISRAKELKLDLTLLKKSTGYLDLVINEIRNDDISKLQRMIEKRIEPLFYKDGIIPKKKNQKKLFAEPDKIDNEIYPMENSYFQTINYIGTTDLNRGYIIFYDFSVKNNDEGYEKYALDLNTGDFVLINGKEDLARFHPVLPTPL